ncbi:gluconokinase [Solicola gregarius]|uniref:Gluconokinase n=1 Tax=Solicola gregarius TaxID=2908642 RepID=A0AA46YJC4_9ACTN|nr:gluconokinase [Solicola gregarius]UYM04395.1 gluconokinase [Solicola gregarius]
MPERNRTPAPLVVVMGVSAVGKTTVGEKLAARFGVEYADADAFHPQANIDKMSGGVPLTDDDRWPWLAAIGKWLDERTDLGGVVSCSALKRAYRDVLVDAAPSVRFLHLDGDSDVIRARIARRKHHFMPPSLIDSQLATLEPLEPDEPGAAIDLTMTPDAIVDEFLDTTGRSH